MSAERRFWRENSHLTILFVSFVLDQFEGTSSYHPTIELLLRKAIHCRTADGTVDSSAMNSVLQTLVEIGNTEDAFTNCTRAALGRIEVRLVKVQNGIANGRSGASVYHVQGVSGAIVPVSKIFPKAEVLVRELSSLTRLLSPEFTHLTVPLPLAAATIKDSNGSGILVSRAAQGISIADSVARVGHSITLSKWENLLTLLCQAVIGTSTLHYSMDTQGNPIGAPGRDAGNFGQGLTHFCRQANFSEDEVKTLQEAFLQEY